MTTLLEIRGLNTYYGESHILRNVDLTVQTGEMVCLIGRNGVGKTTLLKSLIGLLNPKVGEVLFNGESVNRYAPHRRARAGIGYVPQGREIIPQLTVEENLMLGMEALPGSMAKNRRIDPFVWVVPILQGFFRVKVVISAAVSNNNWQSAERCSVSRNCCFSMNQPRATSPTLFRISKRLCVGSFLIRVLACSLSNSI